MKNNYKYFNNIIYQFGFLTVLLASIEIRGNFLPFSAFYNYCLRRTLVVRIENRSEEIADFDVHWGNISAALKEQIAKDFNNPKLKFILGQLSDKKITIQEKPVDNIHYFTMTIADDSSVPLHLDVTASVLGLPEDARLAFLEHEFWHVYQCQLEPQFFNTAIQRAKQLKELSYDERTNYWLKRGFLIMADASLYDFMIREGYIKKAQELITQQFNMHMLRGIEPFSEAGDEQDRKNLAFITSYLICIAPFEIRGKSSSIRGLRDNLLSFYGQKYNMSKKEMDRLIEGSIKALKVFIHDEKLPAFEQLKNLLPI